MPESNKSDLKTPKTGKAKKNNNHDRLLKQKQEELDTCAAQLTELELTLSASREQEKQHILDMKKKDDAIQQIRDQLDQARQEMKSAMQKWDAERRTLQKDKKSLNTRIKKLTTVNSDIKKELKKIKSELEIYKPPDYETNGEIKSPVSNFNLAIYPGDDQNICLMVHPLTRAQETFPLDANRINQFILKHVSAENEIEMAVTNSSGAENNTAADQDKDLTPELKSKKKLQSVRITQFDQDMQDFSRLSAGDPFYLHTRLHLDKAPDHSSFKSATDQFGISAIISDKELKKQVANIGKVDRMQIGVRDYEETIAVTGLEHGTYQIDLQTIVPFMAYTEQQQLEITCY